MSRIFTLVYWNTFKNFPFFKSPVVDRSASVENSYQNSGYACSQGRNAAQNERRPVIHLRDFMDKGEAVANENNCSGKDGNHWNRIKSVINGTMELQTGRQVWWITKKTTTVKNPLITFLCPFERWQRTGNWGQKTTDKRHQLTPYTWEMVDGKGFLSYVGGVIKTCSDRCRQEIS